MPKDPAGVLCRAADRARTRPEFLGWVLARYEDLEEGEGESLREQLRVHPQSWPWLQLCLRPRAEAFLQDVTAIAQAFGIDRAALAAVVRRVDAVEVIRKRQPTGQAGRLIAARTRKRKRRPPNSGGFSQ